jgi:MoaA/NifB/PqqE/SkfB family radical SAM enzyme
MSARHLLNLTSDHLRSLPILILYLTDGCNSRCITCDIWRAPRLNMRRELVETLVASVKPLGIRWVVLSGGEAMQHPHWAGIAARFRDEGARVILLTNGLFLRRDASEVIANIDEVVVSLDGGTAETYAHIRGVDAFDLVLEGIRAVREGGVTVTTRTTVQRANYHEMPLIVGAAKAAGANHISFLTVDVSNEVAFGDRVLHQAIDPSALTSDDLPIFERVLDALERDHADDFASGVIAESPAKLRRMVSYFGALLGEGVLPPVRCNAPHTSVVVQVDGSLRPCYFLPTMGKVDPLNEHVVVAGRARHALPLQEVLNSNEALALRRAYRCGERAECARCVCPLHKGARALLRL